MRSGPLTAVAIAPPIHQVVVDNLPVYIDHKNLTAQFNHPGARLEDALPRSNSRPVDKPRKGVPSLYFVEPQPNDLLKVRFYNWGCGGLALGLEHS